MIDPVTFLARPLAWGSLTLPNRVLLAPLAGVTDVPFRRICADYGAGLTYVEMLVSVAVIYHSRRTYEMMNRHHSEQRLGVQLTGRNVDEVVKAAGMLDREGFDTIDINMGCPVRKVVHSGSGSAFLKDTQRISDTLAGVKAVVTRPLSAKCRIGFTREALNITEVAPRIATAGCDAMTIHGRTRDCTYAAPVQYDKIREGAEAARNLRRDMPVIGNGNVFDRQTAALMLTRTGVDGVMVSRGALGNPWLFAELTDPGFRQPTIREWLDGVLRHLDYHQEHYGDSEFAARAMRKHLIWYANGFPYCAALRGFFNTVTSLEAAKAELSSYAARYPSELRRYEDGSARVFKEDPKYQMDREIDRGVGDDGVESSTSGSSTCY
ncbi:MAG TPA: tRNA dihydrouridine synthase DusB [Kiritimatiellia bacterium]|nr:tRNA dihydrouridine synthase DusB [Kiritimatiellia bacterium]HMO99086.1 tRNA dihydrouridine synthase DusB [Kiritimatiellia bacterium]HMP96617.1 tRNA dihydrouridine synthase DusB [Kiritimatiellia bacterium]